MNYELVYLLFKFKVSVSVGRLTKCVGLYTEQ